MDVAGTTVKWHIVAKHTIGTACRRVEHSEPKNPNKLCAAKVGVGSRRTWNADTRQLTITGMYSGTVSGSVIPYLDTMSCTVHEIQHDAQVALC